jgi:hypothetical protein
MSNMLPTVLTPFLPLVWALLASAFWWRQLPAPWLFLVAALLALFGIQTVVSFLWDYWPSLSGGGYFLEQNNLVAGKVLSDAELQRRIEEANRVAITKALIVLAAAIPFLLWLKNGLSLK